MKKILVTGKNSYVGNSLEEWLQEFPEKYSVDTISVRGTTWNEISLSNYDVVFHVAGIAHVSSDPKKKDMYYKVNRDLTIEVAKKAKADGVKQFIFMSSIIVYGDSSSVINVIDRNTDPRPSNFYGDSKLQAEQGIKLLESDSFKVAIIRPPMIYGENSKGNYPKLSKLAKKLPLFPDFENKRSMLHIDNLSEFIKVIIDREDRGLFFPQNKEYVSTSEMVKLIADVNGRKLRLVKFFNPILKLFRNKISIINKVFGNLLYDKDMSNYDIEYQIRDFKESIIETEKKTNQRTLVEVLLMSDNGLETVGGEQESTKIIINGIKGHFSVGVIQPGEIKNSIPNVDIYHLTNYTRLKHLIKHPLSFLGYINKVKKIVNTVNPKVIHSQAQVSFFIISLLRKTRLISPKIKLIHTERGLYTKYSNFIKLIFRFFIKEIDVWVTTTNFNMKYWKEATQSWGMKLQYKIIENTAGELFELYDDTLEKADTDYLVVGFAGRYTDWKNWPLAVEISKKLSVELGTELFVKMAVGCLDNKAKLETEKMFSEMRKFLGNRFTGQINIGIEEMDEFYYDLDFFILTSNYNTESFGRTLVEAMSRKTLVLTTNAGGSVEVVGNFDNVCDTSSEFVQRVIQFYEDENLMNEEKMNNMVRVKELYSLKNNTDKHIKLYSSLLNSK